MEAETCSGRARTRGAAAGTRSREARNRMNTVFIRAGCNNPAQSAIRPRRLSPCRRGCSGRFPLSKLAALHGRPEGAGGPGGLSYNPPTCLERPLNLPAQGPGTADSDTADPAGSAWTATSWARETPRGVELGHLPGGLSSCSHYCYRRGNGPNLSIEAGPFGKG